MGRLECGDARGATDAVLDAISRALLRNDAERAHLLDLVRAANATAAAAQVPRRPARQPVRPELRNMLEAMSGVPACIRNGRLDILAGNALAQALFAPIFTSPARPVNAAASPSWTPPPHPEPGAPQPGHEDLPVPARLPDITPVPRPGHQRPGTRRAVRAREPQITPAAAYASTASGHGHTMATGDTASDPFSRSAQHGRSRPRGCAASGCDDRHHADLLPRADGALRSSPSSQRSAVQKQEEISKCRRR